MPRYSVVGSPEELHPMDSGPLHSRLPAVVLVQPADDEREPLAADVTLHLRHHAGVLTCTGCDVHSDEVTAEILRRIPVGRWAREAVHALALVEDPEGQLPLALGGHMTDALLADVARVYRWSVATGEPPFGKLERDYGIPRAKASRWVSTARRRGLL